MDKFFKTLLTLSFLILSFLSFSLYAKNDSHHDTNYNDKGHYDSSKMHGNKNMHYDGKMPEGDERDFCPNIASKFRNKAKGCNEGDEKCRKDHYNTFTKKYPECYPALNMANKELEIGDKGGPAHYGSAGHKGDHKDYHKGGYEGQHHDDKYARGMDGKRDFTCDNAANEFEKEGHEKCKDAACLYALSRKHVSKKPHCQPSIDDRARNLAEFKHTGKGRPGYSGPHAGPGDGPKYGGPHDGPGDGPRYGGPHDGPKYGGPGDGPRYGGPGDGPRYGGPGDGPRYGGPGDGPRYGGPHDGPKYGIKGDHTECYDKIDEIEDKCMAPMENVKKVTKANKNKLSKCVRRMFKRYSKKHKKCNSVFKSEKRKIMTDIRSMKVGEPVPHMDDEDDMDHGGPTHGGPHHGGPDDGGHHVMKGPHHDDRGNMDYCHNKIKKMQEKCFNKSTSKNKGKFSRCYDKQVIDKIDPKCKEMARSYKPSDDDLHH